MPTTSTIGIPTPLLADNNDTATAMTSTINYIDPILNASYTQTQINAITGVLLWTGRRVYNSTRGCWQFYTGAAWVDEQGVILNAQTVSYTLVLADANNKLIQMNAAGALNLNVPTNASVAFPIGTVISGMQYGAGQVTIQAVTPATTFIRSSGAATKSRLQYSEFSLVKLATDEWLLSGDVV